MDIHRYSVYVFIDASNITDQGESIHEKGNMDVEITIDAVNLLEYFDAVVLFSGDSDFLSLVNYLRSQKKQVFVISSKNNVSQELRTGADGYIDILKINDDIWGRELRRRETFVKNKNSPSISEGLP